MAHLAFMTKTVVLLIFTQLALLIFTQLALLIFTQLAYMHTPYDYLQYVLQYPKSVCYNSTSYNTTIYNTTKCTNPPPPGFTIHGLWPSNKTRTRNSSKCSGTEFNKSLMYMNQPLKTHLEKYSWPDVKKGKHMKFWADEWSKHGKCSDNVFSQIEYFKWCDDMWKRYPIGDILQRSRWSVVPGPNKYYNLSTIKQAIIENTSYSPTIRCANSSSNSFLLIEVVICFDYWGNNITNCRRRSNCPDIGEVILYPD